LAALGHEVTVVDNFCHGHREAVPIEIPCHDVNIGDGTQMIAIMKNHGIEAVMHFASLIEVGESVKDPALYYRNNVSFGLSLLNAVLAANIKKFVFSSTAAVYGMPTTDFITEDHPLQPINPYGQTKLILEKALADYCAAYGLGYVVLRYFNVAGADPSGRIGEAHEPETHLIPRLLAEALKAEPAAMIYGTDYPTPDGTCIRDYIHVNDLVAAHALALDFAQAGRGETFNLGSERGFSVREVIATCRRVTKRRYAISELPRRAGDPPQLVAAHAKAKAGLGWTLRYPDLETMVAHAWAWHRARPLGYKSIERTSSSPEGAGEHLSL
jgi:UDP-glucose 4-epimerase